jgi:hypothetical protein
MIDDNQKKFIPHLAIENDFFHSAFVNPCKTKGAVRAVCALLRICPLSTSWAITVQDGALALKGSHSMGDGQIFLKTRRDVSFNKVLWNKSTFGRIHLAGQYL